MLLSIQFRTEDTEELTYIATITNIEILKLGTEITFILIKCEEKRNLMSEC